MSDSGDDCDLLSDSELARCLAATFGKHPDASVQSTIATEETLLDAQAAEGDHHIAADDEFDAAVSEVDADFERSSSVEDDVLSEAPSSSSEDGAEPVVPATGVESIVSDAVEELRDSAASQPAVETVQSPAAVLSSEVTHDSKVAELAISSPADHAASNADAAAEASSSSDAEELEARSIEFVNTVQRCRRVCKKLRRHATLAFDIEGIRLGRHGEICLVQVANHKGHVFLFDITELGKAAFANGLEGLLVDESITKLFFDCRGDVDALFHLYRVKPKHVLDMQVLCHKATGGDSLFLQGFAKAAEQVLPYAQRQVMKGIKEAGQALFAPEKGGSLEVFRKRPMSPVLQKYCAQDVAHLFQMQKAWGDCIPESTLRLVSELRMNTRITSRVLETGPQLARRDFYFPGEPKTRSLAKSTPSASPEKKKSKQDAKAKVEAKLGLLSAKIEARATQEAKTPPPQEGQEAQDKATAGNAVVATLAPQPVAQARASADSVAPSAGLRSDKASQEMPARSTEETAAKRQRTALIQIIQPQIPA